MDEQGAQPARQAIPLVDDLSRPGVELRETHISWVFLSGGYAWKIKKPVDLGFLDFSTPEKRRRACDAEVRLNRRLAPRVYRGVEPVTLDAAGRHRIGGEGPAVDWAVRMIRLPDDAPLLNPRDWQSTMPQHTCPGLTVFLQSPRLRFIGCPIAVRRIYLPIS